MNQRVAAVTAKKIVYLVARDERRYNFSLNKTDADIALPGPVTIRSNPGQTEGRNDAASGMRLGQWIT